MKTLNWNTKLFLDNPSSTTKNSLFEQFEKKNFWMFSEKLKIDHENREISKMKLHQIYWKEIPNQLNFSCCIDFEHHFYYSIILFINNKYKQLINKEINI